ncbi:hypothetical protein APSETT445_000112 [Aspergillus pseudonomiae]
MVSELRDCKKVFSKALEELQYLDRSDGREQLVLHRNFSSAQPAQRLVSLEVLEPLAARAGHTLRRLGDITGKGVVDRTASSITVFSHDPHKVDTNRSRDGHIPLACVYDIAHRRMKLSGAFWPGPSYRKQVESRGEIIGCWFISDGLK